MDRESTLHELKINRDHVFGNTGGRKKKSKAKQVGFYYLFKGILRLLSKVGLEFKKRRLVSEFYGIRPFNDAEQMRYLAIRITGGIGDVVCISRWIYQVKQKLGQQVVIDVFFTSPELTRFILLSVGVRSVFNDLIFRRVKSNYDAYLVVNQLVTSCRLVNYERIVAAAPELITLVNNITESQSPYQRHIDNHPKLDGFFADAVVANGLSRKDFLSVISGFDRPDTLLPIELPDIYFFEEIGLGSKKYITIHDGWDANFKLNGHNRPTKSFPIDSFAQTVALIKQHYPHVKIVQLGASTGQNIDGADINLRGKTSFEQSALILKQAIAHIDTESGLVHLATSLGTPCVVVFGSTNFDYYGYHENHNIKPKECGNCMWVTDTWMESCPLQYNKPKCTESIVPSDILDELNKVIVLCDNGDSILNQSLL